MEKKRISDERRAELIRAAALRREVPVGLETRVMAQVILRDRRRRERGRDPRARTADRCRRFSSVGEGSRAERHGVPSRKRPDGYSRTE